jgi:hypothetical protein
MHRGALHFGAFLLALTTCVRAFAHGLPPEAYAVISHDAEGPRAVSFSSGVALRRSAQRYQFVCPMAWRDQFASPLAALADGTIVIGAAHGLMLLSDDGTLRAHPDPAAVGRSSDVVRSPLGVFSLRSTAEGSEVLAIDAQTVHVLWKDTKSFSSLAVLGDKLVLLRALDRMLEQVTIAVADGAVLDRQVAFVDLPVDNVFARVNAGAAYALVVFRNVTLALGSLRMNTFTKLAQGEVSIAGPLNVENVTLLALDGKLSQLVGDQAAPLPDDHAVVCLAESDGLTYACESHGIARLSGQVLGEPLFRFEWLLPPDLERVPAGEDRMICNMQWQDFLLDLQLTMPDAGIAPADPPIAQGGAGAPPLPAATPGNAGVGGQPAAAGGAPVVVPEPQAQAGDTSCAMLPGRGAPRPPHACAFGLVLALGLLRCRRGRRR